MNTFLPKRGIPLLALFFSLASLIVSLRTTNKLQTLLVDANVTVPQVTTFKISGHESAADIANKAKTNVRLPDAGGTSVAETIPITTAPDKSSADPSLQTQLSTTLPKGHQPDKFLPGDPSCAILFVGLGRSYKSIVLPSIIQNVIPYNPNCDYFVHTYTKTFEAAGRSGFNGILDPTEIFLLQDAIANNTQAAGEVEFQMETDQEFSQARGKILKEILYKKNEHGTKVYFPFAHKSFTHESVSNIIKQWHSMQSAWQLMEQTEKARGRHYTTVAVLRSDVVFLTPIEVQNSRHGITIPGFARYPVNDRLVYGPRDAIQIYATERFSRLDNHVEFVNWKHPGTGIHPESYLNFTIFPAMLEVIQEEEIYEHPSMCFVRARTQEYVWIKDCIKGTPQETAISPAMKAAYQNVDMKELLEQTIGRSCPGKWNVKQRELWCPLECNERCRRMFPFQKK